MAEKKKNVRKEYDVPLWQKVTLNLEEAVAYTGISRNKLREIADGAGSHCVIWVGNKRMFKRKQLEEYLEGLYSL